MHSKGAKKLKKNIKYLLSASLDWNNYTSFKIKLEQKLSSGGLLIDR